MPKHIEHTSMPHPISQSARAHSSLATFESRRLLPAHPAGPVPSDDEIIRRWRSRQIRQALRTGFYDEEAALDGALEKLAADLGVSLKE